MTDVALRTTALSKRFGGLAAVNDVSLELVTGEIHAVIGPNGAGKTTLVNLLSGDLKPTGGTITLGERDVTRLDASKRGLLGIGRSYQKTMIFPDASVFENVRLAVQAHGAAPPAKPRCASAPCWRWSRSGSATGRANAPARSAMASSASSRSRW